MRSAALAAALLLFAGCGSGSGPIPAALVDEARWMASVEPPDGWRPYRIDRLTADQLLRDVDGVAVIFAGDFRDMQEVEPTSAGVAWESPVLGPDDGERRCAEAAGFMAAAGAAGPLDVAACVAAPSNPDLRPDFVYSFWSEVEAGEPPIRSFGGGVVLDDAGAVTVVVSLAAGVG